ncbi:MAG TPA: hypothetical protein VNH22_19120 [Blastocatellia bacterium]|jgi:hypothetical protein|nr:hypothetical protein [Blastocatellia bacterium]
MKIYLLALSAIMLGVVSPGVNEKRASSFKASKREASFVRLQSSEKVFDGTSFIRDAATPVSSGRQAFYVACGQGLINVYDGQAKASRRIPIRVNNSNNVSMAIDLKGNIYVADSKASEVVIANSHGQARGRFSVPRPDSIAVLKNGNVVIASPSNNALLHMYTPEGRWLKSFGELKSFDQTSVLQNNALNRGRVLADSFDNIYYVSKFALDPYILKFSSKGKQLVEFPVTGEAVDLQREVGGRVLANSSPGSIGGILILTSASIDPGTNHIWVSMNGSSETGLLYEYNDKGEKLKEYALAVNSRAISGVNHLLVKLPLIYAFTFQGAYRFDVNKTSPDSAILAAGPCPVDQGWPVCGTNCNTSETADDKDCSAELKASVNYSLFVVKERTCSDDESHCDVNVLLCNKTTGGLSSHSLARTCTTGPPGFELECEQGGFNPVDGIRCDSPVVVDMQGNGVDLTGANDGVGFDIDGNGTVDDIAWTSASSDDAWLALDRNRNGAIDDGRELFGNYTPQIASPTPNGFLALAEYDKPANGGNGDDRIDNRDAIFPSLRLWKDLNHNGVSEPGELSALPALGLTGLDLDYKEKKKRDEHGNWFRYRGQAFDSQGAQFGRWAWDVYLTRAR